MSASAHTDQSHQRLAAIIESSEDGIVSKDLDGIVTSWNRGAERIFGYRADEVIGQSIVIIIPEDLQGEEPEILQRIRNGERIEHYETVRQRKDRSLVEISLTVSPVRNGAGRIVGVSKIARDISARRKAEQQARELSERLHNLADQQRARIADKLTALWPRPQKTSMDLPIACGRQVSHPATCSNRFDNTLKGLEGVLGSRPR